jgi:hypothetical protein
VTTPLVDSDVLAEAMRAYQSGDASAFDRLYAGLGINSAAAKLRASRGVNALRTRLEDERDDDEHQ